MKKREFKQILKQFFFNYFIIYKENMIYLTKKIFFMFLLICFSYPVHGDQVIQLPDLCKPDTITADSERLYVTESEIEVISIYSMRDFKLIKKFGQKGEGPGEFIGLELSIQKENLMVASQGKISYFTKQGTLQTEVKVNAALLGLMCKSIGKGFLIIDILREKNGSYHTFNLLDEKFDRLKEIFRAGSRNQLMKSYNVVYFGLPEYYLHNNKIFIVNDKYTIEILDYTGKKISSINHDFPKIKFTKEHKKKYLDFFHSTPRRRRVYELIKEYLQFPGYFPFIRSFRAADGKVYVLTYKEEGEESEFYIFDTNGLFLKKTMLPIKVMYKMAPYPFTIKDNKLYQLNENQDEEQWELHITNIKADI